ncbi:MAG: hypothetical protein H6559_14445 [Lewinellaceae bacterium]|nr:hypothetical protein [Lewinellaceae bacterium]
MFPSKLIIEVNDLTPDWLDKMKQAYKEATLEIHALLYQAGEAYEQNHLSLKA